VGLVGVSGGGGQRRQAGATLGRPGQVEEAVQPQQPGEHGRWVAERVLTAAAQLPLGQVDLRR